MTRFERGIVNGLALSVACFWLPLGILWWAVL